MKKLILLSAAVMMLGTVFAAKQEKFSLVTIDSNRLLAESKRGHALQRKIEQQAQELQEYQQKLVADLRKQGEELQKKAKVLSQEAQQKHLIELRIAERKMQRELEGRREDLQMAAQQEQEAVRRELVTVATGLLEKNEWGALIDVSAPAVLASAQNIDVTEKVLAEADMMYEKAGTGITTAHHKANSEVSS